MTNQQLKAFAYHISNIMTEPAGTKWRMGIRNPYDIEIKRGNLADNDNDVWNQVYIDGKWCGNRCGGRDEYAELVYQELMAPAVV